MYHRLIQRYNADLNRKRTQDLDTICNNTPIFCETPARYSEYKVDNVLDRVFTASNNKIEHEIEVDIKCDSGLVEMKDRETVDFSQFVIDDIRSASPCRSHSCLFDNSPSSFVSTINSYHATAPVLLPSNTANDFKNSPRIVTPRLYTSNGTEDSQNISGDQQHGQRAVSDAPRQTCSEPMEAEWPHSSFTAPQQTPSQTSTNFKSRENFLARNRHAAHKCRQKRKTRVAHLLEREQLVTENSIKLLHETEKIKEELKGLRSIAADHYNSLENIWTEAI
jgi:hypothetical protein